jgi:hypothetical protein
MMKTNQHFFAAIALVSSFACAQVFAQSYQPNTGQGGFQDIVLDDSTFYVAFMGNVRDPQSGVESGWQRRTKELCATKNANFFVELAYGFEDPRVNGKDMLSSNGDFGYMKQVKAVYIPIYIPTARGPRFIDGPIKQAAVRCYREKPDLSDPARLQTIK